MSISDKITRLITARNNIRTAINNKGGSASSHGFEDFATDIGNMSGSNKAFDVTLASAITGAGTLVYSDTAVAAHYTDTNAQITIRKVDNILTDGVWCITAGNTYCNTSYGVRCNSSSGTIGSNLINYSIAQEPTTAVSVGCNANGDIKVRMSATKNCLPAGTYKVIFSW